MVIYFAHLLGLLSPLFRNYCVCGEIIQMVREFTNSRRRQHAITCRQKRINYPEDVKTGVEHSVILQACERSRHHMNDESLWRG